MAKCFSLIKQVCEGVKCKLKQSLMDHQKIITKKILMFLHHANNTPSLQVKEYICSILPYPVIIENVCNKKHKYYSERTCKCQLDPPNQLFC